MTTATLHAPRALTWATKLRRTAWLAGALFWTAFAIVEGVNHGWPAAAVAFAFFLAPDIALFVDVRGSAGLARGQLSPRAVPYYNAAHWALIPFASIVAYTFLPVDAPALFAGLCGWLAHISYDRAFGYGLRTKEGFQRV
ncbi:DUF4260 family protein [Streptomyces sp. TRM66268-LWL]|uniref:DUF4260 family protein n=1 Tax=Streptomyces polyasparticus TaxID=2767826 RepID=A0ABR7SDP2_9ACTN|nr:DUF4260 family protein [Streptomyces polyasparticus]MBC9712478.1 DUF4260 family protein [Streptomyces polyasparticus]